MTLSHTRQALFVGMMAALALAACAVHRPQLHDPATLADSAMPPQTLKAHLRSGELAVLETWRVEGESLLVGSGTRYSPSRTAAPSGDLTIPVDSIALLETRTNRTAAPAGLVGMAVWSTLMGITTAACVIDPKSCFGSCPTFYADGDADVPVAEGFSASFARVLEARDVDALPGVRPRDGRVVVTMRNEALETHAVRSVRLLAVPRSAGARVFATAGGQFFEATDVLLPNRCTAAEGSCLDAVSARDRRERTSLADSTDLAARETLELEFAAGPGRYGIVIGARHTFVSTFLFYQTIASLGGNAGQWLAALERGDERLIGLATGMARYLGGIDVAVMGPGGAWDSVGTYDEAGPIATDLVLLPLPDSFVAVPARVRLRLAAGNWRVDYVALVRLGRETAPVVLQPLAVERGSAADPIAAARLADPERYLVTYPGDAYRLDFLLPAADADFELFLDTRGYYYEWMRTEWLADEDPAEAALVLFDPPSAARRLAPEFKRIEDRMERLFWQSRFGR